jgi:hypothetical protein
VRDKVSHPYRTTGKIIVLYTLISVFLIANWKIVNPLYRLNSSFQCRLSPPSGGDTITESSVWFPQKRKTNSQTLFCLE